MIHRASHAPDNPPHTHGQTNTYTSQARAPYNDWDAIKTVTRQQPRYIDDLWGACCRGGCGK